MVCCAGIPSGPVAARAWYPGAYETLTRAGLILEDRLSPRKARLRLMLGLAFGIGYASVRVEESCALRRRPFSLLRPAGALRRARGLSYLSVRRACGALSSSKGGTMSRGGDLLPLLIRGLGGVPPQSRTISNDSRRGVRTGSPRTQRRRTSGRHEYSTRQQTGTVFFDVLFRRSGFPTQFLNATVFAGRASWEGGCPARLVHPPTSAWTGGPCRRAVLPSENRQPPNIPPPPRTAA